MIRRLSGERSYARGLDYYRHGAVGALERRGRTLSAEVAGSGARPYRVDVRFDDAGVDRVDCTCPYDYGDLCKHIVAVLLKVRDAPEPADEQRVVEGWLEPLSEAQLRAALLYLTEEHPEIAPSLGAYLATAAAPSERPQERWPSVDLDLFRSLARSALHGSSVDWDGFIEVDELNSVLDKIRPFLDRQDYLSALTSLEAVADALFVELEDDGYEFFQIDVFFQDYFDAYFAEAALGALLSDAIDADEWARLQDVVAGWQTEAGHDGDYAFNTSEAALEAGWDDPTIAAIMDGERLELDVTHYPDRALVEVRLTVLERAGRHDDYLNLARAANFESAYLQKLIELGQTGKALGQLKQTLTNPDDAFAVAKTLAEQGDKQQALETALYGLELGRKDNPNFLRYYYQLAQWTRDLAWTLGANEQAIDAAMLVCTTRPSLADYQALKKVAGDAWPEHRDALLSKLREQRGSNEGRIDIFLHEGLVDDAVAIAAADDVYLHRDTTARVLRAATETHPDWVIEHATALAEPIMDAKRSGHYQDAAGWLEHAQRAYLQSGRAEAWQAYLAQIKERYHRQRKLMGFLNEL